MTQFTRRDFLKLGGAALAAVTLPARVAQAQATSLGRVLVRSASLFAAPDYASKRVGLVRFDDVVTILGQAEGPGLSQGTLLTRFIRTRELAEIQRASAARQPATLGRFFTPDPLLTLRAGASQLSLGGLEANPIVAIIRIPASEFRGIPFGGPSLVAPKFGQIGAGLEMEFLVRPTIRPESIVVIPIGVP